MKNIELPFIKEMFDSIAPRYDLLNRLLSLRQDVYWRRKMISEITIPVGGVILDMACGTGASAVTVAGILTKRTGRSVMVHLKGGVLEIEWNEKDNHVYMTGPAVEVFDGVWAD